MADKIVSQGELPPMGRCVANGLDAIWELGALAAGDLHARLTGIPAEQSEVLHG